jgi:hypothetical protein
MAQKVSSEIPSRQKEKREDTASSDRSRQQRWRFSENTTPYTGHCSQGIWGLQQALVVGISVPVALPAGGGAGGVFDGGRAEATRRAEATSDGSATASTEATSKAMAAAIGVAAASTQA